MVQYVYAHRVHINLTGCLVCLVASEKCRPETIYWKHDIFVGRRRIGISLYWRSTLCVHWQRANILLVFPKMLPRTRYGTSSKIALSRNCQHKNAFEHVSCGHKFAYFNRLQRPTKIAWIADISRSKSELIKKWNKINRSRLMYAWVLAIRQYATKQKISDERGAEVQSKLSSRTQGLLRTAEALRTRKLPTTCRSTPECTTKRKVQFVQIIIYLN